MKTSDTKSVIMLIKLTVILISIFIFRASTTAQDVRLPSKNSAENNFYLSEKYPVTIKKENSNLSRTPENNFTEQEKQIISRMETLKDPENTNADGDRILQLQKELEKTNGSSVTRQGVNDIGTIIPASRYSPEQTDNLSYYNVITDAGNYVASLATQVEQRGVTAGKIWIAVGLANGDTGIFALPDTIAMYYSVNNGVSYNLYAKIAFSSHNKIEFDKMDMEIIENLSGTKYIHIVFSYITNGGYGQHLIGYTVVSAPTLGYAGSTLFPPGYNANSVYTNARITSDNTRFPANPFITIVITQDSLAGQNHFFMSKVCRVLSPYTLTPSVTYLSHCIYGVAPGHNYDVTTDVANYHNGSDSLIFVLSGYPGGYEPYLYFYKAYSNSVVYPVYSGIAYPSGDNLYNASIAANGGTNQKQMMITYSDDYLNTGDFDQWVLSSYDAVNWYASNLDYTSFNNSRYGDVIGRRDAPGSFAVSFKNIFGSLQNVAGYGFTNLNRTCSMHSLNTDFANSFASPKPVFRYLNSDSCLNIWSYYYSVSATGGCGVSNLYVKTAVQGFYDENADEHSSTTVMKILLAETSPPYNIVDTGFAYVEYQRLSNVYAFPKTPDGYYYLIAKHYNCIETWSSVPVYVEQSSIGSYDFTDFPEKAYGNNTVQKGSKWCFYSGDVDQDGNIDLNDVISIHNDASEFVAVKYAVTDLNGDSNTDLTDLLLGFNNSSLFISKITPP